MKAKISHWFFAGFLIVLNGCLHTLFDKIVVLKWDFIYQENEGALFKEVPKGEGAPIKLPVATSE